MKYLYHFPHEVIERDGPFHQFAKDASIVTVEMNDGTIYSPVVLVCPDLVGAMPDVSKLPFDPSQVSRISQTPENLSQRSSSDWTFFTDE